MLYQLDNVVDGQGHNIYLCKVLYEEGATIARWDYETRIKTRNWWPKSQSRLRRAIKGRTKTIRTPKIFNINHLLLEILA